MEAIINMATPPCLGITYVFGFPSGASFGVRICSGGESGLYTDVWVFGYAEAFGSVPRDMAATYECFSML